MTLRRTLAITVVAALVGAPTVASAYVARGGSGSVQVGTDPLPAGAQPAASATGRDVLLRWAPSRFSDGAAVGSYGVHGVAAGAAPVDRTCPGAVGADGRVACAIAELAPGTWTFTVTPVEQAWVGTASAPATSTVAPPTVQLSPSTTTAGSTVVVRTVGWLGAQSVTYRWQSPAGPVVGGPVTTAPDGSSQANVTVPAGTPRGSYQLHASGSRGDVAVATVTVANRARNTAPVAVPDELLTVLAGTAEVAVLGNDTDPDGDALTVAGVGRPRHGTAAFSPDRVSYLPESGYFGDDSFTYTASDGNGGTATGTVTVFVGYRFLAGTTGLAPSNVVGGGLASATDPMTVEVRTAQPGTVQILLVGATDRRAPGWVISGRNAVVRAPAATAAAPTIMIVRVESLPAGKAKPVDPLAVYRNGVAVPDCTPGGQGAAPDPCVVTRSFQPTSNDYVFGIRTSSTN